MPLLICPNDNNQMMKVSRNDVEIDICPTCNGVWLDRGELNKLLAAETEQNDRSSRAHQKFQEEVRSFERDPDGWKQGREYDQNEKRYRYNGDDDDDYRHHGGRKHAGRRGRLSLLDFFD